MSKRPPINDDVLKERVVCLGDLEPFALLY